MPFDRGAQGWLPGLLLVAVVSFQFTTAWVGGPAPNWRGQTSEYYPLLVDAFLAGQTNLLVQPSAELLALPDPYDPAANGRFRLHDASLYGGKYYLYFGPTPAIALFLPYKVLTGSHLPTRIAVALFCVGGLACSWALFWLLAKREKWDCPPWFGAAAVLSLGTAPAVSFLLARPSFYEVAIGAGYCFVMAGFLLTAHSLGSTGLPGCVGASGQDPPRTASLVGAGLCFGLAVGCRPNLALLAVLMAALVVFRIRASKTRVLAFLAPVVLCGVLLAGYNYARFHNPFEFGIRYQLVDDRIDLYNHFRPSLGNLLPGIYLLGVTPTQVTPFGPAMGLLWGSPIALLGLCTPCILRYRGINGWVQSGSTRFTIYSVYLSVLSISILLALMGFILGRYTVDFAPEFLLLSWCLLAARWRTLQGLAKGRQIQFQIAVVGAVLYSAALGICICWSRFPR